MGGFSGNYLGMGAAGFWDWLVVGGFGSCVVVMYVGGGKFPHPNIIGKGGACFSFLTPARDITHRTSAENPSHSNWFCKKKKNIPIFKIIWQTFSIGILGIHIS